MLLRISTASAYIKLNLGNSEKIYNVLIINVFTPFSCVYLTITDAFVDIQIFTCINGCPLSSFVSLLHGRPDIDEIDGYGASSSPGLESPYHHRTLATLQSSRSWRSRDPSLLQVISRSNHGVLFPELATTEGCEAENPNRRFDQDFVRFRS